MGSKITMDLQEARIGAMQVGDNTVQHGTRVELALGAEQCENLRVIATSLREAGEDEALAEELRQLADLAPDAASALEVPTRLPTLLKRAKRAFGTTERALAMYGTLPAKVKAWIDTMAGLAG